MVDVSVNLTVSVGETTFELNQAVNVTSRPVDPEVRLLLRRAFQSAVGAWPGGRTDGESDYDADFD